MALLSVLTTARSVMLSHAYLPTADLLVYADFLQASADGQFRWADIWERHNGIHRIVLPKLVFFLDMRLTSGSGWLVAAVSALLMLCMLIVILQVVFSKLPWSTHEKTAFGLLCTLLISSAAQMESLVSPINIQWSFLAFGIVLTASSLERMAEKHARISPGFCLGVAVTVLSAGPFSTVLLSLLFMHLHERKSAIGLGRWICRGLAGLLAIVVLLEWVNRVWLEGLPLFVWFYRPLLDEAAWTLLLQAAQTVSPTQIWAGWLSGLAVFLGQFLSVPLSVSMPAWVSPAWAALALGSVIWLFADLRNAVPARRFLLYTLGFTLCLGVMAGLIRPLNGYTLRFANMGIVFAASAWLLVFHALHLRAGKRTFLVCALLMGAWVLFSNLEAARHFTFSMNNTRLSQVAYAIGIRDDAAIVNMPGASWMATDASLTRQFAPVWKGRGLGVFASQDYQRYEGSGHMPADEMACEHHMEVMHEHAPQGQTFFIRAQTRTREGRALTNVVFQDAEGHPIGYGIRWVPRFLLAQWRGDWQWQAYLHRETGLPDIVHAVAYDDTHRCAAWVLALRVAADAGKGR